MANILCTSKVLMYRFWFIIVLVNFFIHITVFLFLSTEKSKTGETCLTSAILIHISFRQVPSGSTLYWASYNTLYVVLYVAILYTSYTFCSGLNVACNSCYWRMGITTGRQSTADKQRKTSATPRSSFIWFSVFWLQDYCALRDKIKTFHGIVQHCFHRIIS